MNKARFESFSDGVFAFAVTLLVLGLTVPNFASPPSAAALAHALLDQWPNLLAYLLSFTVIGVEWHNHHAMFRLVARVDRNTVFLNLALLAPIVFTPFATATLGRYPRNPAAAFLYGATLTATAIVWNVMLEYLSRRGAFTSEIAGRTLCETGRSYRLALATYAAATLIALRFPVLSFGLYIALVAWFLLPRGVDADLERRPID